MKNSVLLLKTLLLSTSGRNIYRHSKDKKKRKKVVGGVIGLALLYLMVMGYSIAVCIGYGFMGLIGSAPVMCALVISALAFMFTVFKTNGYLFNFTEYDMLMSLPFEAETVAASKFLYMYVKSLPWYLSISLAMMAGYGYYARPAVYIYPVWLVLSLFLPVIPMLAAAFIGYLIARVSAGFRKTNLIQTVLMLIFVILCFSLRFILEELFRNNEVQQTLEQASDMTGSAAKYYLPVKWFSDAVTGPSPLGALLLIGVSALLFAVVFRIVGRSYRNINSALKSHAAARKGSVSAHRQRSAEAAVAFKEFRRMTGSTQYTVNGAIGVILAALVAILTLAIGPDRLIRIVAHDAPLNPAMLDPAIPLIVYFFTGMVATTAFSPSLEGKNYWILQSLPIEMKTVYRGKMLFNMVLTAPVTVFSVLCLCIAGKVPVPETVLYLLLGIALCAFSTTRGCVCGIRHMRLDWENEIEVIKQSSAVAIYMLPNMFAVMGLAVVVIILGMRMDHRLLALIQFLAVSAAAALSYRRVMALAVNHTVPKERRKEKKRSR